MTPLLDNRYRILRSLGGFGTTQEEERTLTVQLIEDQPQIVDSTLVRVTQFREKSTSLPDLFLGQRQLIDIPQGPA